MVQQRLQLRGFIFFFDLLRVFFLNESDVGYIDGPGEVEGLANEVLQQLSLHILLPSVVVRAIGPFGFKLSLYVLREANNTCVCFKAGYNGLESLEVGYGWSIRAGYKFLPVLLETCFDHRDDFVPKAGKPAGRGLLGERATLEHGQERR